MALHVTPIHRNLQQRVTFLCLEFEDLFAILLLAAATNVLGRFLHRELFGLPMNVALQYVVPVLAVPFLILFKYGKPRGYLVDFLIFHAKPKVYCGLEPDGMHTEPYLLEPTSDTVEAIELPQALHHTAGRA